jgi:hypothetical protein
VSKPATETELIIKIKKALLCKDSKTKIIEELQKEKNLLAEMLDIEDKGAGKLFEMKYKLN